MNIITISREFGSGGREIGKRLADILNYDYYDSEIIQAVANNKGMDAQYVEKTLSSHGWRNYNLTFRNSFLTYGGSDQIKLLLEQKKVIEDIARLDKDCVIVGRNADIILEEYEPLKLFICANMEAKLQRCRERAPKGEDLSDKQLLSKIKSIDKGRSKTREIMTNKVWGQRDCYQLIVNTTDWNIKGLSEVLAQYANAYFGRSK